MTSINTAATTSNNEEVTVVPEPKPVDAACVKHTRYNVIGKGPKFQDGGSKFGERPGAPSKGEHARARAYVINTLGRENVTPKAVVKLAGFKTLKDMRAVAEGQPGTDTSAMKEWNAAMKKADGSTDTWAQGRDGAAILVGWIDCERKDMTAYLDAPVAPIEAVEPEQVEEQVQEPVAA